MDHSIYDKRNYPIVDVREGYRSASSWFGASLLAATLHILVRDNRLISDCRFQFTHTGLI